MTMRKKKKGLDAAIGTQHDDEKGRSNPADGKIALGDYGTALPHTAGGTKKHRKNQRLDG
jgi:hypothetical protein